MIDDLLLQSLHSHLAGWGLRQFTSDKAYFQWQRENTFVCGTHSIASAGRTKA